MSKEKCEQHTGCVTQIQNNKDNIETLFEIVDKIRNRLPNWATVLMMILTGIIGWLLSGLGGAK